MLLASQSLANTARGSPHTLLRFGLGNVCRVAFGSRDVMLGHTDPQVRSALLVAECPAHRRRTQPLPAWPFVYETLRDVKFIDVQRTIDDCSFKLKARLIRSVGSLRISRSGLRALVVQMEAVLDPMVVGGVIEGYTIVIPVLDLLDADPASLTAAQLQVIQDAQTDRVVEVLVAVDYAGAIHRIAITLKFE